MSGHIETLPLALIGIGAVIVLAGLARWSPSAAIVLLTVAMATSAINTQLGYIEPGSSAKAQQRVIVQTVAASSAVVGDKDSCVAYDGDEDFNFFSDRLLLGTRPLELLLPGHEPCGPLVISSRPAFATTFVGSRMVIDENDVDEALYVLPGDLQNRLGASGWLVPNVTPGPLPLPRQQALIQMGKMPASVRSGATARVPTKITNNSLVSPWPAARGLKQTSFAVRIAVRWYLESDPVNAFGRDVDAAATRAVDLPTSLLPLGHAWVNLPLTAATTHGVALRPGRYRVVVSVYQERNGDLGKPTILEMDVN